MWETLAALDLPNPIIIETNNGALEYAVFLVFWSAKFFNVFSQGNITKLDCR